MSTNSTSSTEYNLPPNVLYAKHYTGLVVAACVFLVSDTIFFVLRTIARRMKRTPWGWDDILIIPAYIMNVGICIFGLVTMKYAHVGRHNSAILELWGHDGIASVYKAISAIAPIWEVSTALSKLSILCLYLRVFPQHWIRYSCYFLMAFIIGDMIACTIASFFYCQPLSAWFNQDPSAKCFNALAFFVAVNVPHVFTDTCMLLLPLPVVLRLHMTWAKKIGAMVTFLCGSMGLVGSVYRLWWFASGSYFVDDIPWGTANSFAWSIVEPGMCFAAACLLVMRPILTSISQTKGYQRFATALHIPNSNTSVDSSKDETGLSREKLGERNDEEIFDDSESTVAPSEDYNYDLHVDFPDRRATVPRNVALRISDITVTREVIVSPVDRTP